MADNRHTHCIPNQNVHVGCLLVFGNVKHLLVGHRVTPAEAEQLRDRQTPGIRWKEESAAPMAQCWNEAVLPKLMTAKGFTIVADCSIAHDFLAFGNLEKLA